LVSFLLHFHFLLTSAYPEMKILSRWKNEQLLTRTCPLILISVLLLPRTLSCASTLELGIVNNHTENLTYTGTTIIIAVRGYRNH
jgi:hypothetical protein